MSLFFRFHRGLKRLNTLGRVALLLLVVILGVVLYPGVYRLSNGIPLTDKTASMYFVQPAGPIHVGQIVTVELRLKTGSEAINAVSATISIDPKAYKILSISTERSFCSFYPENTFDTIKGEIRISCGTPSPGFLGDSPIVQAQIRSQIVGTSEISLSPKDSLILANDGKGTNLLSSYPSFSTTTTNAF